MTYKQRLQWLNIDAHGLKQSRAVCSHATFSVKSRHAKRWYAYCNAKKLIKMSFTSRIRAIAFIEENYYSYSMHGPVEHIDKRGLHRARSLPRGVETSDVVKDR